MFVRFQQPTVRRKVWVHDTNTKRKEKDEFHHLVKELEHPNRYEMYFRMTKEEFYLFT